MLAKPVGNLWRLPIDKLFKVSIMITSLLLHAKVVYEFFQAKPVLDDLVGSIHAWVILIVCVVTLMLLCHLCWRAYSRAQRIDQIINRVVQGTA
jgi:hypothetical protein